MGKTSIIPANGISLVSKKDMELIRDEQETESSIDASGVATYAAEYNIKDRTDLDRAKLIAKEIMTNTKAKVMEHSPEFIGHIKMFLDSDADRVKMNVTAYFEDPAKSRSPTCPQIVTMKTKVLLLLINLKIKSTVRTKLLTIYFMLSIFQDSQQIYPLNTNKMSYYYYSLLSFKDCRTAFDSDGTGEGHQGAGMVEQPY